MFTHKDTLKVILWKGAEFIGLFLFLALIPRMMGPELYGDFAIMLSVLGLFILSNALGGLPVFGRFLPEFKANNQTTCIKGLFTQFFIFRLISALVLAVVLWFFLTYLRPDFDAQVIIVLCVACVFGAVSLSCTHLFYGLNKMTPYLFHDSFSRMLLVLILLGYWSDIGLQISVYALTVIEVVLASVLVFLSRNYFSFYSARNQFPTFYKHLKFGLAFFASNLLLMVVWRSGEILISFFTAASEQVAYYHLSNSIFLALTALLGQVAAVLIPSINTLHSLGEHKERDQWLRLMFVYLTVVSVLALIVVNSIGQPVLLLLLGPGYSEVTANLCIILISIIPLNMVRLGITVAMVHSKTRDNLLVACVAMFSFIFSAVILIPMMAAKGASFSVVISSFIAAGFSFHRFKLWKVVEIPNFGKIIGVGIVCIGLIESNFYPRVEMGFISLVFFMTMMLLLRIVKVSEIRSMISHQNKEKIKVMVE